MGGLRPLQVLRSVFQMDKVQEYLLFCKAGIFLKSVLFSQAYAEELAFVKKGMAMAKNIPSFFSLGIYTDKVWAIDGCILISIAILQAWNSSSIRR